MKREEKLFKVGFQMRNEKISPEDLCGIIADRFNIGVVQNDNGGELYLDGRKISEFLNYVDVLKSLGCQIDVSIEYFCCSDWEHEWKKFIKPVKVGNRLIVRPSWEEVANDEGRIEVVIDPEMAFGTGHHETTQLCLEWLDSFSGYGLPRGLSLLDVGTGSGIIAITAVKFGFSMAVGIDIDTKAVSSAAKNVERNGVKSRVKLVVGSPDCLAASFDVVVANINAGVLRDIAHALTELLNRRPGSFLVLSGILLNQEEDISRLYRDLGFKKIERRLKGEWSLLVFTL